jgi:hypothetical protein
MGSNVLKSISYLVLIISAVGYAAYAIGFYAVRSSSPAAGASTKDVFESSRDIGDIPALREMMNGAGR